MGRTEQCTYGPCHSTIRPVMGNARKRMASTARPDRSGATHLALSLVFVTVKNAIFMYLTIDTDVANYVLFISMNFYRTAKTARARRQHEPRE